MTEEALFELASNAPEAERAALLDRECAENPVLRARVEALLRADAAPQNDSTVTHPGDPTGVWAGVPTPSDAPPIGTAGLVVGGKYQLIEPIGEGGMGSVWLAHQTDPVNRKVAVKLIKAGMDSKAVIGRFEAERQALAVMDHPNIAKILDGGLHGGRPYFVMELVKGVPITEFCDARRLTPRQRLELFVPVCLAIQHAHQKGIIHRDIKPNNVLVTLYDDKPVPKVIDFGLAKATGGGLTDLSISTGLGSVVGTPQYMSPEQASLSNLDIDTRSDIYSLGVLLYELLAGSPPFKSAELQQAGLMEMLRVVREVAPPKPSTKLSSAEGLPSLSANRGTEPKALTALLRRELDWVVMKALEKDRGRRYETANGFAADVNRYLAGEAVLAHPPSAAYRIRKFLRKNRRPALAVGVVLAACVLGTAGTVWGFVAARQQRDAAETARAEAESNAVLANTATASAQAAEAVATREKRNALASASSSALDQAQQICENGDVVRGLHLMSSALPPAIESGNAPLEEAVRLGIAAWLPHSKQMLGYAPSNHVCACLSPDGAVLVTGSHFGVVQLWDAKTFQKSRREYTLGDKVLKVAWQPKGDRVAILCRDGTLRLWRHGTDFKSARVVKVSPQMNDVPHGGLSFSPDGSKLLVGALGRSALLLDVAEGKPIGPGFLHGSTHSDAVAISPDGTRVVVGTPNWSVRVYELATAKPLTPAIRTHGSNYCAGISPDGTKFFTGHHMDASLQVWEMKSGQALGTRIAPGGPVLSAMFSPDSNHILIGGWMALAGVWDWRTGKSLGSPIPGEGYTVAYTPDGAGIVVNNVNGTGIWKLPDRGLVWTSERLPGSALGFTIRQDSKEFALTMTNAFTRNSDGNQTQFLRRYDLRSGEPIKPYLPTHRYGRFPRYLDYSLDDRTIYCAEGNGLTKYDLTTNRESGRLVGPKTLSEDWAFSSDGRFRASLGEVLSVYDAQTGQWSSCPYTKRFEHYVVSFIPGTHCVYDCTSGSLYGWNLDEPLREPIKLFETDLGYVGRVACRADGKVIALMNTVGNVVEYDLTTYKPTGFSLGSMAGNSPLYSVDGRLLFLADQVGTTSWHPATHKKLGPYVVTASGGALGVTPDGEFLITVDDDRRLQCWRVPKPIEGTAAEVEKKITTHTGLAKFTGNRLGIEQPKLPGSVSPPAGVTDYREIHNAELPALKAWYAALPENFRPMHLSVQLGSDGKRFDALALDDGTATVYEAHLGLKHATAGGALPNLDDGDVMWPLGWQQSSIVAYMCDGVYHRHHVWTRGPTHDNSWHPLKDLGLGLQHFRDKRQRPIGVIEYGDNLYLNGGPDLDLKWELHHDLTADTVREKLADARTRKWRPDLVHRHDSDADKFAVVLVENPNDVPWEYHTGLSVTDFGKRMADFRSRGYRPQHVHSWVGKDDVAVYSGVWFGDFKPRPIVAGKDGVADATVTTGSGWLSLTLKWLADQCRGLVSPDGVIHWSPALPKLVEVAPTPREKP